MTGSDIPEAGERKRGESGHIAYLLRQASAALRAELETGFADTRLTLPQFTVLTMLRAYPGISGADLARISLLTPQTVNVITANLLKRGAVARGRSDTDRRAYVFTLTEEGRCDLEQCETIADAIEARLVAGLDAGEEALIRRWLVAIARGAGVD